MKITLCVLHMQSDDVAYIYIYALDNIYIYAYMHIHFASLSNGHQKVEAS